MIRESASLRTFSTPGSSGAADGPSPCGQGNAVMIPPAERYPITSKGVPASMYVSSKLGVVTAGGHNLVPPVEISHGLGTAREGSRVTDELRCRAGLFSPIERAEEPKGSAVQLLIVPLGSACPSRIVGFGTGHRTSEHLFPRLLNRVPSPPTESVPLQQEYPQSSGRVDSSRRPLWGNHKLHNTVWHNGDRPGYHLSITAHSRSEMRSMENLRS
ncbi:hypothetical protein AB1N83_013248 [Pleurotus pulmonarius]